MSEQRASLNNIFLRNLNEHFNCKNSCLPTELNIDSNLSETIHHKYEYIRRTFFLSLPLSRYPRQLAVLAFSPRLFLASKAFVLFPCRFILLRLYHISLWIECVLCVKSVIKSQDQRWWCYQGCFVFASMIAIGLDPRPFHWIESRADFTFSDFPQISVPWNSPWSAWRLALWFEDDDYDKRNLFCRRLNVGW